MDTTGKMDSAAAEAVGGSGQGRRKPSFAAMTTSPGPTGGPGAASTSEATPDAADKRRRAVDAARQFRQRAIDNGYQPIRVATRSKQPRGKQWQLGEPMERLLAIQEDELNTGILAAGLRCIDGDIENPQIAAAIEKKARAHFPGAPHRRRANSSRFAFVVRAAHGEPSKRSIEGQHGKLEVLGAGQQFVAHGVHPSGDVYEWQGGRGPDSVPVDELPAATEEQINDFLNECSSLIGSTYSPTPLAALRNIFEQPPTSLSTRFSTTAPAGNDLSAGIESAKWFDGLSPGEKATLVRSSLEKIDNRSNDPRPRWLQILFAVADAGQRGCPDAHALALTWSQCGASWTGEADFDKAWDSFKPGAVTIGSLLKMARDAGLDLSPWRDLALTASNPMSPTTTAPTLVDPFGYLTVDPDNIPPHRQWSVGTKLIKGEVAILAAKGGWGKSSYTTTLLCSAASALDFLNEVIWGDPKRVLYINSEDDTDEVQRKFIAAAQHHKLTRAQLQNIMIRGVNTPGHETLTIGDESAPRVNEAGFTALEQIITRACAEIAILDPLGTFCPAGLNDNGVMGQVMLRLKRLAKKHKCAILVVHHTRKDGDLTNVDAIGGASAIVNQARVALMLVRMTADESKNFKGVLPSEVWRYFRIVDAKTNFAPPGASTQWYQLVSHELPNAEPPTYTRGDGVQVVDILDPAKLSASPLGSVADDIAKRAILKAAFSADPPFSPSRRGGSERYIVRQVLGTVRQATGKHLADRDLIKHVEVLVEEMMALGWLYVADVKVAGNKRQGVMVNWAVTPWAHTTGASPEQGSTGSSRQIRQKGFETIRRNGTGGIDAPRPTGASNVPKRYGDLTAQVFDAAPINSAPAAGAPTEGPVKISEDPSNGQLTADCVAAPDEPPAKNEVMGSERANMAALDELLAQNADRLGIPDVLLRRGRRRAPLPTAAAAPPVIETPKRD